MLSPQAGGAGEGAALGGCKGGRQPAEVPSCVTSTCVHSILVVTVPRGLGTGPNWEGTCVLGEQWGRNKKGSLLTGGQWGQAVR